ncbi:hypothetical protein [Bradyrhizobium arachidis]|nr:hypothetical protein [Bradyrhizobium arachidis]
MKFERRESEFRKRDRAERAADLCLPLDEIRVRQGKRQPKQAAGYCA